MAHRSRLSQMLVTGRAPSVRTGKNQKVFHYNTPAPIGHGQTKTAFFAERGIIHIIDEVTGNYTPTSRAEFFARAVALNGELQRDKYPDEIAKKYALVMDMLKVLKQAKQQGDPFDVDALMEMMRARHRAHVLVPGGERVPVYGDGGGYNKNDGLIMPGE